MSLEIRSKWPTKKLNDIAEVILGQSPPSSTYNKEGNGLPFFQGKAEFTSLHPQVRQYSTSATKIAQKNDILLSVRAPIGPTNVADQESGIGRGLAAIRYPHNYKYLLYYFKFVESSLDALGTGTTFRAITGPKLRALDIPYPSPEDQEKIVAIIEELFSEIDAGRFLLKTTNTLMENHRESLLYYAFEGLLTRDLIANTGWTAAKFGDAVTVASNLVKPHDFMDYPHVAPDNIERNTGRLLPYRTIREDGVRSPKHLFHKDQIIYSKIRPYLNKLTIAPFDGLCSADMYPLESNAIDHELLFYYMLSRQFLNQSTTAGSRSVLPKINQRELSQIIIKFPVSLEDQKILVSRIKERLSVLENQQNMTMQVELMIKSLKQSILAKAFKGELV